ncbi:MAG: hypothetical protein WBE69_19655 [Candidatus Binataceae bacterium]|jgi:hypothetical protein
MGRIKMSVDIYMDVSYHLKSQARFAFAQQSFLAYPDPRMSRCASRPSSTFFLPHQTKRIFADDVQARSVTKQTS